MHRLRFMAIGLFSVGVFAGPSLTTASAGFGLFCLKKNKDCCETDSGRCDCQEKCCKPKKRCCLFPPDAPEAEIGFAQPGVVRPGQAVPVTEASMRRAVRDAAVQDLKQKAPESAAADKNNETRLDDLEKKVEQINTRLDRLSIAVEKLAEKQTR